MLNDKARKSFPFFKGRIEGGFNKIEKGCPIKFLYISSVRGEYYIYDHLGNTRLTYSIINACGKQSVLQVETAYDYYPYGGILRGYERTRSAKYLSTQHERDSLSGYDYRLARYYDSEAARFLSVDPLAVDYAAWSGYIYVMGNPIVLIDPDGLKTIYYDHNGNLLWESDDELEDAVVFVDDIESFNSIFEEVSTTQNSHSSPYSLLKTSRSINKSLRKTGYAYMVDDLKQLLEKSFDLGMVYENHKDCVTFISASTGEAAGLYKEVSTRYIIENNEIRLSFSKDDFSVGHVSFSANNIYEGVAHTHPNGYIDRNRIRVKDENGTISSLSEDFGGSPGAPPSVEDWGSAPKEKSGYYDSVISPSYIHFYKKKNKLISVPLDKFD